MGLCIYLTTASRVYAISYHMKSVFDTSSGRYGVVYLFNHCNDGAIAAKLFIHTCVFCGFRKTKGMVIKMKKSVCYIVSLSMILSIVLTGFAYSDIGTSHSWAESALNYLDSKNILNGYDDGTFKPDGNVTRAELAKILAISNNLPDQPTKTFSDVKDSDWFYKYAIAASILFKTPDGKFYPEKFASREEVAYAICTASGYFKTKAMLDFSDTAEITNDYYDAVSILTYNKIITGYEDNTFRPKSNVARIEIAAMVHRALTNSEIPEPAPSPTPEETGKPTPNPDEKPAPTPEVKANNYFCLVTKVSTAVENGSAVTKATVYNEGEIEEIVLSDRCKITPLQGSSDDSIKANDIVTFFRDAFNDVRTLQVLYRLGSSSSGINPDNMPLYTLKNSSKTVFGEAIKLYKNTAVDLKGRSDKTTLYGISRDVNVYIFKSGKLELSDLSMLMDTTYEEKGDYVLGVLFDDELKEILIIKE